MQCTVTDDTFELPAEVYPLAHFNAKWHKNQLKIKLSQLKKISDNYGETFITTIRELVYKYADVYTKPGKPVVYDIKHKIELLGPAKPVCYHRLQRMSEKKITRSEKSPEIIP